METKHLPIGKWVRPGELRLATTAIVMHWTGKAQQTPLGVWHFWQAREDYGSAHYIIGNNGAIIEAMPQGEVAYHVGSRSYTELAKVRFGAGIPGNHSPNWDTIGIELCHVDWEGTFTDSCLREAVNLVASLCKAYDLNPYRDILTHNMVVGWKKCPLKWVKNPADLELFRIQVASEIK